MRALITGVTGFAGTHLAEHLLAMGDTVLGCNRSGRWHAGTPQCVQQRTTLVAGDVGSPQFRDQVGDVLRQFAPDVIYHLAALSIPADCGATDPTAAALAINVDGTRRVLELAASLPRPPHVVFASSSHVYPVASADSPPIDEQAPIEPRGPYGRTKLAAEGICREFAERHGLDVLIMRQFPQAGPRQDPRLMLASWCRQFAAASNEPIEVLTLDATIDMVDVRDAVRAYRLLAMHGQPGETYHVGSGVSRTSGEVFEILQRAAGTSRPVVQLRPGKKFDPIADLTRLKQITGWQPEIAIDQTVADALDEYRALRLG
ncbi:MAG: GDP-mannose 4,6-dehydratase [Planctomycetaceae bacterium]|nr:GDP-mannose 4,6-dehydratase [Planctomycetaceae bacterium]